MHEADRSWASTGGERPREASDDLGQAGRGRSDVHAHLTIEAGAVVVTSRDADTPALGPRSPPDRRGHTPADRAIPETRPRVDAASPRAGGWPAARSEALADRRAEPRLLRANRHNPYAATVATSPSGGGESFRAIGTLANRSQILGSTVTHCAQRRPARIERVRCGNQHMVLGALHAEARLVLGGAVAPRARGSRR